MEREHITSWIVNLLYEALKKQIYKYSGGHASLMFFLQLDELTEFKLIQ